MFCIRPDSGRLFASSGLRGKFSPDRRAVTWVYFPDLEQQCYDLPEPHDHDTQAFDAAHSKLVEAVFASVRAAARLPQPAASLAKLRQTHPLKTYRIEYDDLETVTELDI